MMRRNQAGEKHSRRRRFKISQNQTTFWAKCVRASLKHEIEVHRCQETENSQSIFKLPLFLTQNNIQILPR